MSKPFHLAIDVADNTEFPFYGEVPRSGDHLSIHTNKALIRAKVISVEWVILIEGTARAMVHYETTGKA